MNSVSYAFELAALANAAMPELQVVGVHQPQLDNEEAQMTGLTDTQGERWVVFAPRETKTVAQLEAYGKVLYWLNQAVKQEALGFHTPMPEVFIARSQERYAMVYPDVGGSPLQEEQLHSDELLASSLGKSLAALHNLAASPGASALVPVTESIESRARIGTLLENTKDVPVRLSRRWRDAVAESTIWQFQPGFLHGNLTIEAIQSKASVVTAITGFADACIDDPALDLQCLLPISSDDFIDGIVEHYSRQRNSIDLHLVERAQLYSEIAVLKWLLHGRATRDRQIVESAIEMLDNLDAALDGAGLVRSQRKVYDIHFTADDEPLIQLRRQQEEENSKANGELNAGAKAADTGSSKNSGVSDAAAAKQTDAPAGRAFSRSVTREATGAYHRFTAVDTAALTMALRQLSPEEAGVEPAYSNSFVGAGLGAKAGINEAGTGSRSNATAASATSNTDFASSQMELLDELVEAETAATQVLHKWAEEAEAQAAENPQPRKPDPLTKANPPQSFGASVTFSVDSTTTGDNSDSTDSNNFSTHNRAFTPTYSADTNTGWEFFEAQTTALSDLTADLWEIDELLPPNPKSDTTTLTNSSSPTASADVSKTSMTETGTTQVDTPK